MNRIRFQTDLRVSFVLLLATAFWYVMMAVVLPGCPIRVDPATEDVCSSRPNCGLCASEAVCVWCPGTSSCIGRSAGPERCDVETVVSLPEACEVPEEAR